MPPHRPNHLAFLDLAARRTRILTALSLLRDAWDGAGDLGLSRLEFAVDVGQLYAAGLTNTDLRWLISKGYVEHFHERPGKMVESRVFRKASRLSIVSASCFVLTAEGYAAPAWAGETHSDGCGCPDTVEADGPPRMRICPRWDVGLRELWLGSALVKRFRQPAANQGVILSAFEEEGWPPRVDDPLPQGGETDAKVRLHDAIKGLNRHQVHARVRFCGDGTGRSILWDAANET